MRFEMSRIVVKNFCRLLNILPSYYFERLANQNSRIYSPVLFRGINDFKESQSIFRFGEPLASRSISSKIPNNLGRHPLPSPTDSVLLGPCPGNNYVS